MNARPPGAERGTRKPSNGGIEPELDSLIRHIEADQGIEIDRMERLLQ
jgi:hypothetical protein